MVHAATKGGKVGNIKKLTIKKPKKSAATLTVGKTLKIKSKQTKPGKVKGKTIKVKNHVGLRYESSDAGVATVSKTGKITAVAPGTCSVCVYAQNGLNKTVKVTVK